MLYHNIIIMWYKLFLPLTPFSNIFNIESHQCHSWPIPSQFQLLNLSPNISRAQFVWSYSPKWTLSSNYKLLLIEHQLQQPQSSFTSYLFFHSVFQSTLVVLFTFLACFSSLTLMQYLVHHHGLLSTD